MTTPPKAGNTADLGLMRELNKAIVLNLIRQEGSISRAAIAKRTQLSRSTVSNIITELLEQEVVEESGTGPSRVGRRPILVNFNYQAGYVVGVDLGATHLLTILTDLEGRVLAEHDRQISVAAGPDVVLPAIVKAVHDIVMEGEVQLAQVVGVGVGIPGPLDQKQGTLVMPPIMPGWHNYPFRDRLRLELGRPIYIDNDANLGALGEKWRGAGQQHDNFAYIKVGTGIGCGLILNGQVYRGEVGSAGEIGHITIDEDGPRCTCGNYGCLEAMAGGQALVAAARTANQLVEAHMAGNTMQRSLSNQALAADFSVEQIVRTAYAGDRHSLEILQTAGRHIGVALSSLINLLNPGLVIVGGGTAAAGDILLDAIRQTVQQRALPVAWQHTTIVRAYLGREAIAVGAVTTVLQETFKSPNLEIATHL